MSWRQVAVQDKAGAEVTAQYRARAKKITTGDAIGDEATDQHVAGAKVTTCYQAIAKVADQAGTGAEVVTQY